jgi:hypothetical protein
MPLLSLVARARAHIDGIANLQRFQGFPLGAGPAEWEDRAMPAAWTRLALAAVGAALGVHAVWLAIERPEVFTRPAFVHVAIDARSILRKLDLPAESSENRRVHAVLTFLRAQAS